MKVKLLKKIRRRFVIYKQGKGDNTIYVLHDRSIFAGYCDIHFACYSHAIFQLMEIIRRDYLGSVKIKVWFK